MVDTLVAASRAQSSAATSSLYSLMYVGRMFVAMKVSAVLCRLVQVMSGREWMAGINTLSHHVRGRSVCFRCSKSSAEASALALKMTHIGLRGASSSLNAGNHFSKMVDGDKEITVTCQCSWSCLYISQRNRPWPPHICQP